LLSPHSAPADFGSDGEEEAVSGGPPDYVTMQQANTGFQGSILQNSISAEKISAIFSPTNFGLIST
jgi:hypothetical protein